MELQSSLPGLLPYKLYPPGFLGLPVLLPQLQECAGFCLDSPICPVDGKLPLGGKLEHGRDSPHWFPVSQGSLSFVDCYPISRKLLFVCFFICFSKESTSDPCFSSLARCRSQESYLNSLQLNFLTYKMRII